MASRVPLPLVACGVPRPVSRGGLCRPWCWCWCTFAARVPRRAVWRVRWCPWCWCPICYKSARGGVRWCFVPPVPRPSGAVRFLRWCWCPAVDCRACAALSVSVRRACALVVACGPCLPFPRPALCPVVRWWCWCPWCGASRVAVRTISIPATPARARGAVVRFIGNFQRARPQSGLCVPWWN